MINEHFLDLSASLKESIPNKEGYSINEKIETFINKNPGFHIVAFGGFPIIKNKKKL